jgi:hypothetical protein
MADSPTTLSTPDAIEDFGGLPVVSTAVKVTNAGDGLSAAMTLDPEAFSLGQTVVLVLECTVTRVAFEPVSKNTPTVLQRVHTLKAGTATTTTREGAVGKALDAAAVKIEQAKGIERLWNDMDDSDLYDDDIPSEEDIAAQEAIERAEDAGKGKLRAV